MTIEVADVLTKEQKEQQQKVLEILGYSAAHRVAVIHIEEFESVLVLSVMCMYNTDTKDPLLFKEDHPARVIKTEETRTRSKDNTPEGDPIWTVQSVIHRHLTPEEIAGLQALQQQTH